MQAIPLLEDNVPVHVHVVGEGNQGPAWKALAADLGVGPRVTFHGAVDREDLERCYASADVFVLPAVVDDRGDTEGLGVVMIEAMYFKVPVVASNVGGIPDVVLHGRTGLLVPPKEPAALAAAIQHLLRNPELAERLAEQGLAHVREYFDWGRITRLWLDTYRTALTSYECRHRRGLEPPERVVLSTRQHVETGVPRRLMEGDRPDGSAEPFGGRVVPSPAE